MTEKQLQSGNELKDRITLLERDLEILNTDSASIKRIGRGYKAHLGQGCGSSVPIHDYVSWEVIYGLAISGVTNQIEVLKEEFKNL